VGDPTAQTEGGKLRIFEISIEGGYLPQKHEARRAGRNIVEVEGGEKGEKPDYG